MAVVQPQRLISRKRTSVGGESSTIVGEERLLLIERTRGGYVPNVLKQPASDVQYSSCI
jgi:hypothetical protein